MVLIAISIGAAVVAHTLSRRYVAASIGSGLSSIVVFLLISSLRDGHSDPLIAIAFCIGGFMSLCIAFIVGGFFMYFRARAAGPEDQHGFPVVTQTDEPEERDQA